MATSEEFAMFKLIIGTKCSVPLRGGLELMVLRSVVERGQNLSVKGTMKCAANIQSSEDRLTDM